MSAATAVQVTHEGLLSIRLTVHKVDGRAVSDLLIPARQVVLVTVGGKTADCVYGGPYRNGLTVNADAVFAVDQAPAQGTAGLETRATDVSASRGADDCS